MTEPRSKTGSKPSESPLAVAGLGLELAIAVGLLAGGGYLIDGWLGSLPWFTIIGTALGFSVGIYRLFLQLQR
ncbi:MAG: AtpZ/AtpI family protein, partial [Planctomycetota bacterium]